LKKKQSISDVVVNKKLEQRLLIAIISVLLLGKP